MSLLISIPLLYKYTHWLQAPPEKGGRDLSTDPPLLIFILLFPGSSFPLLLLFVSLLSPLPLPLPLATLKV